MSAPSNPSQTHGAEAHGHGDGHPLVGHLVPISTLVATGTVLLVLTVITVAVRYIDLGEMNLAVALGVAVVKATLVGLYFMHLRWDRPFNQLMFVGSIVFVVLLMAFCLMDTKQYEATLRGGNPAQVQTILNESAPTAPIASQVPR